MAVAIMMENSCPAMTAADCEPHSLDGWLAVKQDLFKPELPSAKLRPNIHVCWNPNENKFCITFNEHSRVKSDTQQRCSFADLFGLDDLKNLRLQFSYLCGTELDERYFPSAALSESGANSCSSSWLDFLFRSRNLSPDILDKLCIPLEEYLSEAYRRLTHSTFLSVLYPDDFDFDQYFENLSELRHKTYVDRLDKAKRNIAGLVKTRAEERRRTRPPPSGGKTSSNKNCRKVNRRNNLDDDSKLANLTVETSSDADDGGGGGESCFEPAVTDLCAAFCDQLSVAVSDLLEITAEYFTYLKQPFLDMRELAGEKIRHAKIALESADYGERVKAKLKERLPRWQLEYSNSVENLRDLQLQYFEECRRILQEYRDVLYGETRPPHRWSYFTTVPFKEQLLDAERRLAFENVNYWTTVIQRLKAERKLVISQVTQIDLTTANLDEVSQRLEDRLFRVQTRYLEANVQLLHEKEQYLKLQLKEIRQKAILTVEHGEQDGEDIFYDAVESELQLQRFLEMYSNSQPKLRTLKTELEIVNRQKANVRNKKKRLESMKREGSLLSNIATLEQSPDLRKVIELEQQRQLQVHDDRMREQRAVTLRRIKDYRTKNPALSRTNSNTSLSSSTISNRGKSALITSNSRQRTKAQSPDSTAAVRRRTAITRPSATTKKQELSNDLWSVPPTSTPANGNASAAVLCAPDTAPPPPPPPPPPLQAPVFPSAIPVPPPPPPPPLPPPISQSPTSFFVPLGDASANKPKQRITQTPAAAPMESILHAIKNGVQLKRVDANEVEEERKFRAKQQNRVGGGRTAGSGDVHSQLLAELRNRMNKMVMASSSDSESDGDETNPCKGNVSHGNDDYDDDFDDD